MQYILFLLPIFSIGFEYQIQNLPHHSETPSRQTQFQHDPRKVLPYYSFSEPQQRPELWRNKRRLPQYAASEFRSYRGCRGGWGSGPEEGDIREILNT
jgi:hypothetical protein